MSESERIATITPLETTECERVGCNETKLVAKVEPGAIDESRTLCPRHRAEYLHEVYSS